MSTTPRTLLAVPASAAVLILLAACSGSGGDDQSAPQAANTPAAAQQPAGDQQPVFDGVTGQIAAVSDALMQVQGDDGQTAVTWDTGTAITQTVAATLSEVSVGSCVSAMTGEDDIATTVTISTAVDGECTGGFGGGPGGGAMPSMGDLPEGMPTDLPEGMPEGGPDGDLPEGMPTDLPDGMPTDGDLPEGFGGGFGQLTAGLVTAVDGSTITIDAIAMGDDSAQAAAITVGDDTEYTTTQDADESAISVGQCVVAMGDTDDKGQVTATSLALSEAGDDGCSTGFGGAPGGPGGAGGQGAPGGQGGQSGAEQDGGSDDA